MKGIRYLIIALAVIAALAIAGWLLRHTIIERVSGPILADYDLALIDVSLDALATESVSIGYLELLHTKGTRIIVEDLRLDIDKSESLSESYSAQSVSIVTTSRDDGAVLELAQLISQILSLTDNLAGRELHVAEFSFAPYPDVRDLTWSVSDTIQSLDATIESIPISVTLQRVDEASYSLDLSLPHPDNVEQAIRGQLQLTDNDVSISGESTLELRRWEAIATLAGIMPEAVEISSGSGGLRFEASIPFDTSRSPSANAALTPLSPWLLSYVAESGDSTGVLLSKGDTVEISATFPDVAWSMRQAGATLLVTNGEWREVPLSIENVMCQTGPVCSVEVDVSWQDAEMPVGQAARLESTATLDVSFPIDGSHIEVRPGATLGLTGFSSTDNAFAQVDAHLVSAASMRYADDGWQLNAGSVDASVESLSLHDDITVTLPLFLENTEAGEREGLVSASTGIFVPSVEVALAEKVATLPGFSGDISLRDSVVAFDMTTVDLSKDGTMKGRHEFDSGAGELTIDGTEFAFAGSALSTRISPWTFDFDISAGNVATSLRANWRPADDGTYFEAVSTIDIEALAGFYADTAFTGFSTAVELTYLDGQIKLDPTTIRVDLIDMGLPVENISADLTVGIDEQAIDVTNLKMNAFNGTVSAAPFSFHTGRSVNNIVLTAEQIELVELMAIKEFEAIYVTGSIAALLPITIEQDGISINSGKLIGDAPGGVIRYLGGGTDETASSGIGLVTAALSNFEYESLTSDVTYSKDGNLKLQMRLQGRNPEMDSSRPVILNLGVENNVPQMLKSLQAARAVEEILEKQLAE